MKLTVKTLKGSHFDITVQPTDTIMAVKKNIEDVQGKDSYPCGQQLLIHSGKVLKDESTLIENKVTEDGFLVVMLSKSKTMGSGGSSSSQPSSTSVSTANPTILPDGPSPAQTPNTSTSVPDVTTTNAPSGTPGQDASNDGLEQTIQHIIDIGGGNWNRETVTGALQVAGNNPELAVDYLYSGDAETEATVPLAVFPNIENWYEIATRTTGTVGDAPSSGGPNSSPLNLFPQEIPSNAHGDNLGSLDFLRNNQQFQALRSMVQANPQILQPMLQELGKQNPQLLGLIQENNAEFLELINEPVDASEGDLFDQPDQDMPHAISVTATEQEAIERLEAMGFDRALVIEAYLACDRNEQLAANYLLENAGDFED